MKEGEAEELIMAYIDPSKKRTAEALAQSIKGNNEEVNGFLKGLFSENPRIKEISALFLKRSLALSLTQNMPNAPEYPAVFHKLCSALSNDATKANSLIYETISTIKDALTIDDLFRALPIPEIDPSALPASLLDFNTVKMLTILNRYTEKYKSKEKSNELYSEINHLIESTGPYMMHIVQEIATSKETGLAQHAFINIYQMVLNILVHDLPDYYEEMIDTLTATLYSSNVSSSSNTDPYSSTALYGNASRSIALLRIRVSSVLVSKYSDAYTSYTVFINSLHSLYEEAETMDEGVQIEFLQYLKTLLSNTEILNAVIPVSTAQSTVNAVKAKANILSNGILVMLLNKIEIDDSLGDAEYVQSLLEGDPFSLKDISSSIIADLIARDPQLVAEILAQEPNQNLLYLFLYLIRIKYKPHGTAKWIDFAVSNILEDRGADLVSLSISCTILITAINNHTIEIESILPKHTALLTKLSSTLLSNAPPVVLLFLELIHTLCTHSTQGAEIPVSPNTLQHLMSTLAHGNTNSTIGQGLFHLLRMSNTADTQYYAETASALLISQVDTVGSTRLVKSLWDIITLHALKSTDNLAIPTELIVHCINNNLYEYYTYSLQLLSIINVAYGIQYYTDISYSILSNNSLWDNKPLLVSLTYLAVSLSNRQLYDVTTVIKYIAADDAAIGIVGRYLNTYSILTIYNTGTVIVHLLIRYIKVLVTTEYTEELDKTVRMFIDKPMVQEEDTADSISTLERYLLQHKESADITNRVSIILSKLKNRQQRIKDDPWSLSLVSSVFSRV
ncbi:hypothetical protein NEMIN01_0312 [Nematocida minor]|uniref:uncharacterized protein n=1 Tax=Nematocida minor TaxID=1912983 RepID=UPI00221F0A17|nr:uncharacterized protein NEMIN01_0312 [Nematocida minor]KAI5189146.1 hypothetical protein NEMIN01_0312 [Nematocida minor]